MPEADLDSDVFIDALVECVDDVRQIHADLGTRPFRVFVVREWWTGDRPGEGVPQHSEQEIKPPPRVMMRGLRGELRPGGLEEEGDVVLTEVSLRWTEPELYQPDDLLEGERFYYRIEGAHGQKVKPRYYVPARPPTPVRGDGDRDGDDAIGWRVELRRSSDGESG